MMEIIRIEIPNVVSDLGGPESPKIKGRFEPYLKDKVLDVGAGEVAICPSAVTIDMRYALKERNGCHVTAHAEYLPFRDASFMTVVNSHNLEHIPNDWTVMGEMWRVLKAGGHLLLYLPMKGLFPSYQVYTAHYRDYEPLDIVNLLDSLGFNYDLLDCSILNAWREFSFCLVVRKKS